jgi:hypothetical protein
MPAQRIADMAATLSRFDVIGFDSPESPEFISHVGLAVEKLTPSGREFGIADMIPPLLVGRPIQPGPKVTCFGSAELADFEEHAIAGFVERARSNFEAEELRRKKELNWDKEQFRRDQYLIRPHVRFPGARNLHYQFSCVGFVHEAYAAAGIELIHTEDSKLPPCTRAKLDLAYSHFSSYLDDAVFRNEKGLGGNEPWRVYLPGYILNALDRTREQIDFRPHVAIEGDEYFPPKPAPVMQAHRPAFFSKAGVVNLLRPLLRLLNIKLALRGKD